MSVRTDLAVECREMNKDTEIDGVKVSITNNDECRSTVIDIFSEEGSRALSKPVGRYITLEMDSFPDSSSLCDGRLSMLTQALEGIIPKGPNPLLRLCLADAIIVGGVKGCVLRDGNDLPHRGMDPIDRFGA